MNPLFIVPLFVYAIVAAAAVDLVRPRRRDDGIYEQWHDEQRIHEAPKLVAQTPSGDRAGERLAGQSPQVSDPSHPIPIDALKGALGLAATLKRDRAVGLSVVPEPSARFSVSIDSTNHPNHLLLMPIPPPDQNMR